MQIDVRFDNVKVYNVENFDVVVGQKFSLISDYTGKSKLFSDNDPVLAIIQNGNNASVTASAIGQSEISIRDENKTTIKTLIINVMDTIPDIPIDLGVTSGDAINK